MMKNKISFIVILVFVLVSCNGNKFDIDKNLKSNNINLQKQALDDIWRKNKSEYLIEVINLLKNEKLFDYAAFCLSLISTSNIDDIIFTKLKNEKNKKGYLYYFFLTSKERRIKNNILNYIKSNVKSFSSMDKFFSYLLLGKYENIFLKKAVDEYYNVYKELPLNVKREFILLTGEKKERYALKKVLEPFECENELKPFIIWAKHKIKPVKKIKYDFNDRVIIKNPYWKKYKDNPVIKTQPGTFKSIHTANPDILVHNGIIYLYYRGGDGNDRIAVATVSYDSFNGTNFIDYPDNPVIDIGKNSFDDLAVLDPATIYFNKRVFLYYSGLGKGDDSIGLAISKDFYNFKKYKNNPVLTGRAPEVLIKNNLIYMYYVLVNEKGGYSIYLATSKDGYNFIKFKHPVFIYNLDENAWDSKSVTTPRIIEKNGVYYMIYAGDNNYIDYPPFFGIAFSYDLIHWYRSTQNPIFSRGKKGEWDDGGIWFAQLFKYKDKLYMWYEGWGGGESHFKQYGKGGHSQIGMAISEYEIEDML